MPSAFPMASLHLADTVNSGETNWQAAAYLASADLVTE